MRLTLWTDYALRTLIYLGVKGDELATIAEIARSFDIPKSHLMKIVNTLERNGYVETIRGRNGGLRLGRPASEIRAGAVVRDTEEVVCVIGCLETANFCAIEHCCVLRGALHQATQAFLKSLDGYTLADLVAPRAKLARRLGIAGSPL